MTASRRGFPTACGSRSRTYELLIRSPGGGPVRGPEAGNAVRGGGVSHNGGGGSPLLFLCCCLCGTFYDTPARPCRTRGAGQDGSDPPLFAASAARREGGCFGECFHRCFPSSPPLGVAPVLPFSALSGYGPMPLQIFHNQTLISPGSARLLPHPQESPSRGRFQRCVSR